MTTRRMLSDFALHIGPNGTGESCALLRLIGDPWIELGYSLVRIVEKTGFEARYHPLAMMNKADWAEAKPVSAPPADWRPCSPELLESGVDCVAAPRWSAGPIWQHWHPPVSVPSKLAGEVQ